MRGEAADPDSDNADDTNPSDPNEGVSLGLLTNNSLFDRNTWDSINFSDPNANGLDTNDPMGAIGG